MNDEPQLSTLSQQYLPRIIALFGKSSIGKTRTLNFVYNQLNAQLTFIVGGVFDPNDPNSDRWGVFKDGKGHRVGILTRGDDADTINNYLNKMNSHNSHKCRVIVCASRTKRGVPSAIQDFAKSHRYELSWRGQSGIDIWWGRVQGDPEVENMCDDANQSMAQLIMDEVMRIL